MRVIYVEPGLEARIVNIPHTLSDVQALVGGMIEIVEPFDDPDAVLVSDKCGRNDGKPINRVINEKIDMLCYRISFNNSRCKQKKDKFLLHQQGGILDSPA